MLPFDLTAAQIVFWCVRVFFGTQDCPDVTKQKLLLIWSKKLQIWKKWKVLTTINGFWTVIIYMFYLYVSILYVLSLSEGSGDTNVIHTHLWNPTTKPLTVTSPAFITAQLCKYIGNFGGGDPHIQIQSGICRSKINLFFLIKLGVESREQSYKYKHFKQRLSYEVMHSPKKFHKDIQCLVDHIREMGL